MILQTFKISLTDLNVTCSTTIYKNLSLIMRIQNRSYTIIASSSYFDGSSTIKNRFVDTIDFEFDIQRNKYLPKQIQLELKLIYRTGKINQKVYQMNLNQFTIIRKGVKSKVFKIFQRLYSLNCTVIAKSNGTDSPFLYQPSNIQRVKSQKHFQRGSSKLTDSNRRRFYETKSPEPLIKYTINQNIKITRHQAPLLNLYSQKHIHQQKQKQIIRQSFQLKDQSTSSFQQRNKDFRAQVVKSIDVQKYPVAAIQSKTKILTLQSTVNELRQQFQKQKEYSYHLEKQISTLKNKIEHLIHQKTLLARQKQEDRFYFETKDKEEKMRQKRDIENLRKQYESALNQKQKQIANLSAELKQAYTTSISNLNKTNDYQMKVDQISECFNRKIEDLQKEISIKNDQIFLKNQELNGLIKDDHQRRITIQKLEIQNTQLRSQIRSLQNELNSHSCHLNNIYIKQTQQQYIQTLQNKSQRSDIHSKSQLYDRQNQDLLNLVQKQTQTYHQMIEKLETNIKKLQIQLKFCENQQIKVSNHLKLKAHQIDDKNFQIIRLQKKIKYLEDELFSQRKKNADFRTLLSQVNTSQSILRDKVENQKKRHLLRSYSLGSSYPGRQTQTVKIKTTERYRIVYQPQSQLIYVPAIKYIKNANGSKVEDEKYGQNFNQYNKLSNDSINFSNLYQNMSPYYSFTNGYFGNPLRFSTKRYETDLNKQLKTITNTIERMQDKMSLNNQSKRSQYVAGSMNNYISNESIIQKNKDNYIVQNLEDSYINEEGDYVKKRTKNVYKKN